MHKEIVDFLNKEVPNAKASLKAAEVGDSSIIVEPSEIKNVCKALRDSKEFNFNALQVVSGVDFPEEKKIEVNYMLASFGEKNLEVIIKVRLDRGTETELPKVDSVADIWASANFLERETYDMLGVIFEGHPDLRRILCPYDWEGYPLRKDYVVQEKYLGMVVNPEYKMNNPEREFIVEQNRKNEEAKAREKADA